MTCISVVRTGRLKTARMRCGGITELLEPRTNAIATLGGTVLLRRPASVIQSRQSFDYPASIARIAVRPHRGPGSNDPGLELPITCDYQIAATQWKRRAKEEEATYTRNGQSNNLGVSHRI